MRFDRRTGSRRRPLVIPGVERYEDRVLLSLTINPFNPSTQPVSVLTDALVVPNTGLNVVGSPFVGQDGQAGTYSGFNLSDNTTSLVMPDGILLTSGLATNALGPNTSGSTTTSWGTPGDSELSAYTGRSHFDANSLTIQFTVAPGVNSIAFDFVFGSEEYPEFVGSSFDDTFAAFLDGTQISFDTNDKPITINNNFMTLDNTPGTTPAFPDHTKVNFNIEYDGLTVRLVTQAPVNTEPGHVHTLKFVIADTGDTAYDSGVFLANLRGSGTVVEDPGTQPPDPELETPEFSNLSSPSILLGQVTTTLGGTIGKEGVVAVPTGVVDVTINEVTVQATLDASGAFEVDFPTGGLGAGTYVITYSYAGDANFTSVVDTGTLTVAYDFGSLADKSKAVKSGSTIPVRLAIVGANGQNISSPDLAVKAIDVINDAGQTSQVLNSGNSNPENYFRYDEDLGGYIFNVKTTGLTSGRYRLRFQIGNDATLFEFVFWIK